MMSERFLANYHIAFEAVVANKLRSVLTALGIIFGVAAVIAMLAIGNGAQQEILEQIKLVGVNNIVIEPVVEQTEEELQNQQNQKEKQKFSPGLTLKDVESIRKVIPSVKLISPEIIFDSYVIKNGVQRSAKLVGVEPAYFDVSSFSLDEGRMFNDKQLLKGESVCIIGQGLKTRFFPQENPIGKMIKCGPHWLKVVGVLEERTVSKKSIEQLGIRDYNMDVYMPIQTMLMRYKNRALVTKAILMRQQRNDEEESSSSNKNYHQLDRMVVQVENSEQLNATADVLSRMLKRRHYGMVDYQVTIPELLLKQQQRTKSIFNIVLGAIAGISLLVGGIGIMNIMLASVMERIKEIGLRLSIGAKKSDIVLQFLLEAMLISISGGIIGVILGVALARIVSEIADIPTIISVLSVFISFAVAATVGLIFGITPARKAASQNPITSLRYE